MRVVRELVGGPFDGFKTRIDERDSYLTTRTEAGREAIYRLQSERLQFVGYYLGVRHGS